MNGEHELCRAVEQIHICRATWKGSARVREEHAGEIVWEGHVELFALENHPTASICYAWEEPPETEGGKPKVYTVLKVPPIKSAVDAVRASIVARHRGHA